MTITSMRPISIRWITDEGYFKEFYRGHVPSDLAESQIVTTTLTYNTWRGCGPRELDGRDVEISIRDGQLCWRLPGDGDDHWCFSDIYADD